MAFATYAATQKKRQNTIMTPILELDKTSMQGIDMQTIRHGVNTSGYTAKILLRKCPGQTAKADWSLTDMTEIEYTDSALNDAFVKFFKSFKLGREYKYLDMIQGAIQEPHKIVIDCSDFTPKLQNIMKNETPAKIHVAIYRAITETFQVKFQGDADRFKKNDLFQYEIINHAELAGQTFRKPSAPTKAVLIAQIAKIIKNLPKEDQVFDRVYQPIISKSGIGYMEDFREGQSKATKSLQGSSNGILTSRKPARVYGLQLSF